VYVAADIDGGIAYARKGLDIAQASGIVAYNFWFSHLIICASAATGDLKTAGASLDKLRREWRSAPAVRTGDIHVLSGALAAENEEYRDAADCR
jgi:hypothetical protein